MQHHPPSVARAHAQWQQGCQRASRNDWPGAEANFSAAVRLQPREPIYWLNLARAQLRRGGPAYTLNLNSSTSPSRTTYSLPSMR